MKKWIFSMALMASAAVTGATPLFEIEGPWAPTQKFSPQEAAFFEPGKVEAAELSVKGMNITGFDEAGLAKIQHAFEVLEAVVNSEEFKDRVINFKNASGERKFDSNKGLSNEEVYRIFMEGRETLQPETPGEMNFYLNLYNRPWSKVIGYTTGTTNVINMNWKFFKGFAPSSVASNLAHEWTHKLGFGHTSAKEHDSVPYAIGYIVGEMARARSEKNGPH